MTTANLNTERTGPSALSTPIVIAKNQREEIRVSLDTFRGHRLANLRVWFCDDRTGDWRPGKQGLAFRIAQLPEVMAALETIARQHAAEGGGS